MRTPLYWAIAHRQVAKWLTPSAAWKGRVVGVEHQRDDPALLAEGFVFSPRFAGCLIKQAHDGQYVVFRPIDCKSGKFEMYYQTTDNRLRVDFQRVRHVPVDDGLVALGDESVVGTALRSFGKE